MHNDTRTIGKMIFDDTNTDKEQKESHELQKCELQKHEGSGGNAPEPHKTTIGFGADFANRVRLIEILDEKSHPDSIRRVKSPFFSYNLSAPFDATPLRAGVIHPFWGTFFVERRPTCFTLRRASYLVKWLH